MRKGYFLHLALGGIRKNRKIYYPYILTAVFTTAMMYIIMSLARNTGNRTTMTFALQLGVVVTSLFSVLFLFYTNSFLMRRRKREFGLYNVLGMEKKHLARLVAWETGVIALVSLVLGLALGVLLDKLLYLCLMRLVGEISPLNFYVSWESMRWTAYLIAGTFLLIALNSVRQIAVSKPVELLSSQSVGEREPKTRWLLTLLGLLSLGAGYYLSVTVQDVAMMILVFFVAVLLVIAGTYLLFTAGSITLLKALRRNRRYYYKAHHFISVSGLMYRMKRNAVGLGNICVLSTMVLVMLFSTVALWLGMEEQPTDIEFQTRYGSRADGLGCPPPQEVYERVDEVIAQQGLVRERSVGYRYFNVASFYSGGEYLTGDEAETRINPLTDTATTLYFLPLEDYNASTGSAETLAPGEILLEEGRGKHRGETLTVLGETFDIKKRLPKQLSAGSSMAIMYNCHYIVVDSLETFERLDAAQREVYGQAASSAKTQMAFDVSGSDEQELALREALIYALPYSLFSLSSRAEAHQEALELFGGLLFAGLFLGALFIMAMILIVYYKQITEGYDDVERYRIMRKVGLSRHEIKRSISSQVLVMFFLPLLSAGVHVVFAFPALALMFRAFNMANTRLMIACALGSFAVFALIYTAVYLVTARVYYRIVSE